MRVSTLRGYVRALGGELGIYVRFPGRVVKLEFEGARLTGTSERR